MTYNLTLTTYKRGSSWTKYVQKAKCWPITNLALWDWPTSFLTSSQGKKVQHHMKVDGFYQIPIGFALIPWFAYSNTEPTSNLEHHLLRSCLHPFGVPLYMWNNSIFFLSRTHFIFRIIPSLSAWQYPSPQRTHSLFGNPLRFHICTFSQNYWWLLYKTHYLLWSYLHPLENPLGVSNNNFLNPFFLPFENPLNVWNISFFIFFKRTLSHHTIHSLVFYPLRSLSSTFQITLASLCSIF